MKAKPRKVTDDRQKCFDFVEPVKYDVELVGTTPHGYGLFRKYEGHGGFVYFTDQYGTGYMVYDQGLTDLVSTFAAMEHADRTEAETMWNYIGTVFGFNKK